MHARVHAHTTHTHTHTHTHANVLAPSHVDMPSLQACDCEKLNGKNLKFSAGDRALEGCAPKELVDGKFAGSSAGEVHLHPADAPIIRSASPDLVRGTRSQCAGSNKRQVRESNLELCRRRPELLERLCALYRIAAGQNALALQAANNGTRSAVNTSACCLCKKRPTHSQAELRATWRRWGRLCTV